MLPNYAGKVYGNKAGMFIPPSDFLCTFTHSPFAHSHDTPYMTMDGPAFNHLPPWVKAKLRPLAIQKIQEVYNWVEEECIPREPVVRAQLQAKKWAVPPAIKELRVRAKANGLFNLFLPSHFADSPGLTNLEYGCCAEIMGRCYWAAQVRQPRSQPRFFND